MEVQVARGHERVVRYWTWYTVVKIPTNRNVDVTDPLKSQSPLWQSAWRIWLAQEWLIPPKRLSLQTLINMQVWSNLVLDQLSSSSTPLRRTTNGISSKRNYAKMRCISFLFIKDFLRDDLQESLPSYCLYTQATARLGNMHGSTIRIPCRTCTAHSKRLTSLLMATKNTWLNPEQAASSNYIDLYMVKWSHPRDSAYFNNAQTDKCIIVLQNRTHLHSYYHASRT